MSNSNSTAQTRAIARTRETWSAFLAAERGSRAEDDALAAHHAAWAVARSFRAGCRK